MKLMVVTPYFYPKIGGMENYALSISKELKKNFGYEIVVVTSNHEDKIFKEDNLEGMKIYRLPRQFKISNTPISFKWKKQIKEIIEKEKPDVINGHSPVPFISDITCRIAKEKNIPFVLTYHNDLVKENFIVNFICKFYYWSLGNKTLNQSSSIIATSKYYADNSPYLKKRMDKIKIVSPGTTIPKKVTEYDSKNKIVLFVGQLDKTHSHKGLNYLIEAINLVKEKIENVKLIVIGEGDNLENYKSQTQKLNVEKNVSFLGRVSNEELSKNYNLCSVIVLPTYNESEGFGMVLIDGMAHKRPAIGTNVGGIPYAIKENSDGLIVRPKDSKALAEAIINILENPKLAKEMGEEGYKKVKENFTWDKKAEETNKILDGLRR